MKHKMITTAVSCLMLCTASAFAGTATHSSRADVAGFGGGALIGAAVGGPPGAVIGSAIGGFIGHRAGGNHMAYQGRSAAFCPHKKAQHKMLRLAQHNLDNGAIQKMLNKRLTLDVHFSTNSAKLTLRDKTRLRKLGQLLKKAPATEVFLDGYADPRGSQSYNKVLSNKRVNTVIKQLMKTGITAHRLHGKAHGKIRELGATADDYAFARRVSLHFKANTNRAIG